MAETIGHRLYLIRLACGDGIRDAEPLDRFSDRVKRLSGRAYSAMTLSNLERGMRGWKVEDVEAFAPVDPLKRGRVWLAFGPADEIVAADTGIPMDYGDTMPDVSEKKPATKKVAEGGKR